MEVLVDTSVWSFALRCVKSKAIDKVILDQLSELINDNRVKIIGPIRQELLSGISEEAPYEKLKNHLSFFEDLDITTENYERAAKMSNVCRKKGVIGSSVDFLICSVAEYYHLSIFTTDKDFLSYSKYLPIRLFS